MPPESATTFSGRSSSIPTTPTRFALLDYYIQAPRLVGGGKARAQALAAQTEAVNPVAARLMQAQLALADKEYAKGEAILLAVQAGSDEMAADRQREFSKASMTSQAPRKPQEPSGGGALAEALRRAAEKNGRGTR